jgi:hypothetical protein
VQNAEALRIFFHVYVQDICRCSVFYADHMSDKVEGLGDSQNAFEKKFEVTNDVKYRPLDFLHQVHYLLKCHGLLWKN